MVDQKRRKKIHKRIRAKIKGTKETPRLCIYRSNKHTYAQLINDDKGKTIVSCSDIDLDTDSDKTKKELAFKVGEKIAKLAKKEDIEEIVFDRGGYDYHGRVKALAEGARDAGLIF